jgi:hypothetical protein
MAGRAARAFPDCRVIVLPSTGHVAQMEHPERVAAEFRELAGGAREAAARAASGATGPAMRGMPAGPARLDPVTETLS